MTEGSLAGLRREVLLANRAIYEELARRRPDLVTIADLRHREGEVADRLARARARARVRAAVAPAPALPL